MDRRLEILNEKTKIFDTFEDLDRDLISLAITEKTKSLSYEVKDRLYKKYGLVEFHYKILEYLGDGVLDVMTNSEIISRFKMSLRARHYDRIKSRFVKNTNLTKISVDLGLYRSLFPYAILHHRHNMCANTIESIIGALWIQYGDNGIEKIRNWFFSLEAVSLNFQEIIDDTETYMLNFDRTIRLPNNKDIRDFIIHVLYLIIIILLIWKISF